MWQVLEEGQKNFNPRSSCEERHYTVIFLYNISNFNPRSSCEERHELIDYAFEHGVISIHAPHARSDFMSNGGSSLLAIFQSTLLMRGATAVGANGPVFSPISIHAPHARSDPHPCAATSQTRDFNPRSSCEERLKRTKRMIKHFEFQSTLLMRGATEREPGCRSGAEFQSTLLMRGATCRASSCLFL